MKLYIQFKNEDPQLILSVEETAKLLKIKRNSLHKLTFTKPDIFTLIKIKQHRYFFKHEIENYLNSKKDGTSKPKNSRRPA